MGKRRKKRNRISDEYNRIYVKNQGDENIEQRMAALKEKYDSIKRNKKITEASQTHITLTEDSYIKQVRSHMHSNDFLKRRKVESHKRQIKNDRKNRQKHKRKNSNNKKQLTIIPTDKEKVTGSKGEIKVKAFLRENKIAYNSEHIFSDCINPKTNKELVFDFYLPSKNICIEYDGIQHFEITPDFFNHSIEEAKEGLIEQQYRDLLKTKYCEQKDIKLIRIPYTEYKSIRNILATGL